MTFNLNSLRSRSVLTSLEKYEGKNPYISKLKNQLLFNKPFESIAMRIKHINSVTEDQLKLCSNELFNFNKVTIITFGKVKKDKIEKVLKQFL